MYIYIYIDKTMEFRIIYDFIQALEVDSSETTSVVLGIYIYIYISKFPWAARRSDVHNSDCSLITHSP